LDLTIPIFDVNSNKNQETHHVHEVLDNQAEEILSAIAKSDQALFSKTPNIVPI
jgi:hypothetical protein